MTAQVAMQLVRLSAEAKQTAPQNAGESFQQILDSIEKRAFEISRERGSWTGHQLSDWLQAEAEILHPLHLVIAETEEALNVRAEVPGFAAKELDIRVDGNKLLISGRREIKEGKQAGKIIYSEAAATEIFRSVDLPAEIISSKVNANLKDGILNLELPKASRPRALRIEPKLAS